jgi:hypothetical protein
MPANMLSRFLITVVFFLPFACLAQNPATVLSNTAQPMQVPYTCAEDELQSAGLLCTEDEPCSIYLEWNAIAAAGRKIFLAGDFHATSGTLTSILLASDDGGLTWKEPAARIRSSAIEQVQFHDLERGWAAGETQYPLPRDPFFLVSTDGGASWRQKPVTEDGGPGSIQRFWFDSTQHGELIVDAGKLAPGGRYIAYESETGGESWMVRSTTGEIPKIKTAPAVDNSDYRISPNANGKTVEIEKRLGEKWSRLAAFVIEVASCKVKPPEAKEPPPEIPAAEPQPDKGPDKDYVEELNLGGPSKKPPVKKTTPH